MSVPHSLKLVLVLALALAGCGRPGPEQRVYHEVTFTESKPPAADPHAGHNHGPGENHDHPAPTPPVPAAPAASAAALAWTAPEGWTELPASGMRSATFTLPDPEAGEGASAECTIIILGGMAGTRADNIVRWLGQINQHAAPAALERFLAEMPRVEMPLGTAEIADLGLLIPSPQPSTPSTLAAFLPMGSQTVFVKLTGSHGLIARERERFVALCQSLHTSSAAPQSAPASY